MKKNVMIDLETLGTRAGCVILEIGVVGFDEGDGPEDYETWESGLIALESCTLKGMHVAADTLKWWVRQAGFAGMLGGEVDFKEVIRTGCEFIADVRAEEARVWCWGASFDFPILKDALYRGKMPVPWEHWEERCARTLCQTLGVRRIDQTAHRALADALGQTDAVLRALGRLAWCREIDAELGS
ncbi:MAG: 3'-5' exonuclease [Verrucomicrobiota bacterium]